MKVGRNDRCPCGSGKKYKKCCLQKESQSTQTQLKVIRATLPNQNWRVDYDLQRPPDVFFDTNVWVGMNQNDIKTLQRLKKDRGFRYRYSITNYVELVYHLEDLPSPSYASPFRKYQTCLKRLRQVCDPEALPSPEMELLAMAGLEHYLDPASVPSPNQIPFAIEIITEARDLNDLTDEGIQDPNTLRVPRYIVKPSHYHSLKDADKESFNRIMDLLETEIAAPIKGSDKEKLDKYAQWFFKLANFFFLIRPSNKKINYDLLTSDERDRFAMVFISGAGELFHKHCALVVKRTLNDKKKLDLNDIYDMMQLLLLRNENRLFVTDDKLFYRYEADSTIQRVLPWSILLRNLADTAERQARKKGHSEFRPNLLLQTDVSKCGWSRPQKNARLLDCAPALYCGQHNIHTNSVQQSMQGWLRVWRFLHCADHTWGQELSTVWSNHTWEP